MEELKQRVDELEETLHLLLEELGYDTEYIPKHIKLINLKK